LHCKQLSRASGFIQKEYRKGFTEFIGDTDRNFT
jgi:hypothetical protein